MALITCTRRIQFCAGHRVLNHENKCAHMHGHNYVAFFEAGVEELDGIGRVIDFSILKERLGGWVDEHWDHGFVYWDKDTQVVAALDAMNEDRRFAMPYNPTAENMAQYLLRVVGPSVLHDTPVYLNSVRIWETENCYADANLEDITVRRG
jgi:6-pyruvoyltetrahydropterin/6-carboxytetrahydropterin synthase